MNPIIYITGALYVIMCAVELAQWRTCPNRRAEIIAWVSLGVHVTVYTAAYYYFSAYGALPTIVFNYWSSSLRLHGAITLLAVSWARYRRTARRDGC